MRRRNLLQTIVALAAAHAVTAKAQAVMRLIVPTAAGSGADAVARALAHELIVAGRLTVVENIVGAAGVIGTSKLAQSTKDGRVLGLISANHTVNPIVLGKVPFDPINDVTPVVLIGAIALVLVVSPRLKVRTFAEFVEWSRSNKGAGTEGYTPGTVIHLASAVMKDAAGIAATTVPYKSSGQMVTDLLAGQIDFSLLPLPAVVSSVQAGQLVPLAVTTRQRVDALPEVPAWGELGLKAETVDAWMMVAGPGALAPSVVVDRRREFETALQAAELQKTLAMQGVVPMSVGPNELKELMRRDMLRNARLADKLKIQAP